MDHSNMSNYMAHGCCLLWEPRLIWLHVISDILIGLAYFSIPIAMVYFLFKRRDLPFGHIFAIFALFIFSCGMTHFFSALIIYYPAYWQEGYVKAFTALVSIIGAIMFIPMIPKGLALPSLTKALADIKGLNKSLNIKIDELTIAEKAQTESEEKYRELVEGTGDLVTKVNEKGEFIYVNPVAEKIFGLSLKELSGMLAFEFIHPEDKEETIKWFNDTTSKRLSQATFTNRQVNRNTGTVSNMLWTSNFYYAANGDVLRVNSIARDITERKKMEEQLLQSQKMEAIGTLAGGVAHDFNNILMAIIGFGSMAQKRIKDDEKTRKFIDEMLAGADRAAELTHSLLAFSRKQTITLKQVDLNSIVRKINTMLVRVIGEDIKLTNMLINRELVVMADRGQIEQILLNLAANARDAMPDGGELTIQTGMVNVESSYAETHVFENTGMYAVLSVSDTGIGMDHTIRENIFEPFFTTKEVGKGTGLGLAMVYGMVKQHGGNIKVYSEPGKGTTFRIYLPMITNTVEVEPEAAQPAPLGGGETILLAEDDPQVREITGMYLREFGYKVIEAENGEEAAKRFLENKDTIAIVLLDVIMPVKNGRDAYEAIKKLNPDIKAIFMSGYTDEIISRKGILEKGFDFISKPINPDAMMRKIREVLDRS